MAASLPKIFVRQGNRKKEIAYPTYYRNMQAILNSAATEASDAHNPDEAFSKAVQRGIQNWGQDVLSRRPRSRRRTPLAA